MITATQAAQYLDQSLGIVLPSFVVDAAVAEVATTEAAMDAAGYSATKKVLVQSMAVAIIAAAGAPRRLSNQQAPSGAGRGFTNDPKALSQLRRSLAAQDTAGTVAALVGADPAQGTYFAVVC